MFDYHTLLNAAALRRLDDGMQARRALFCIFCLPFGCRCRRWVGGSGESRGTASLTLGPPVLPPLIYEKSLFSPC